MYQKKLEFEIVLQILKKSIHLRELAKKIGSNPATTLRKVNILIKENILDSYVEGKNVKYFFKKTIEAKTFIFLSEYYNFFKFTRKESNLKQILSILTQKTNNELIIIFGSYAKNLQKKNSDLDIYIETNSTIMKKELEFLDSKLNIKIGKFNIDSILGKEIIKDYIIVQNVERFYEIIKYEKN